ncbi:MAG: diacylglycerol kinase [Bacteroidetes bacterium]|nr:MAG: diacylglycerol kinase [Bacteroidota bacterium]
MTDKNNKPFSLRARLRSFGYAFKGIAVFMKTQHNAWIHLLAACAAVFLGFWLQISTVEWCVVILCIGLVFAAEAFNTAIEWLTDLVSPGKNEKAGKVKDLAAGAVLLISLASAACGIIIFLPKLIDKLST